MQNIHHVTDSGIYVKNILKTALKATIYIICKEILTFICKAVIIICKHKKYRAVLLYKNTVYSSTLIKG